MQIIPGRRSYSGRDQFGVTSHSLPRATSWAFTMHKIDCFKPNNTTATQEFIETNEKYRFKSKSVFTDDRKINPDIDLMSNNSIFKNKIKNKTNLNLNQNKDKYYENKLINDKNDFIKRKKRLDDEDNILLNDTNENIYYNDNIKTDKQLIKKDLKNNEMNNIYNK